jgi:hypothetical protein
MFFVNEVHAHVFSYSLWIPHKQLLLLLAQQRAHPSCPVLTAAF